MLPSADRDRPSQAHRWSALSRQDSAFISIRRYTINFIFVWKSAPQGEPLLHTNPPPPEVRNDPHPGHGILTGWHAPLTRRKHRPMNHGGGTELNALTTSDFSADLRRRADGLSIDYSLGISSFPASCSPCLTLFLFPLSLQPSKTRGAGDRPGSGSWVCGRETSL